MAVSSASPPPLKMASIMEEADWGDEPYVRSEKDEAVAIRTVDASKVVCIRFIIVILRLGYFRLIFCGRNSMHSISVIPLSISVGPYYLHILSFPSSAMDESADGVNVFRERVNEHEMRAVVKLQALPTPNKLLK